LSSIQLKTLPGLVPSMTTTSESLLQRLGDQQDSVAWNRFVALYTPLIFYWGRQVGLQPDDASDLVQDVLATIARRINTFRYDKSKSFRSWLRAVTLNQFRMNLRKKRRFEITERDSLLAQIPDARTLESTWDRSYQVELLKRGMLLLRGDFTEKTWTALSELVTGHASVEEVAAKHGLSVWTLYSARGRLLKRLRSILDGLLE
jgi:RNA polymerase sigma-70 factor, ECF subfamily